MEQQTKTLDFDKLPKRLTIVIPNEDKHIPRND